MTDFFTRLVDDHPVASIIGTGVILAITFVLAFNALVDWNTL